MDIKSALQKLYSLHQFGIKLGLDNTYQLLSQIGNPQKELRCFHVAGSNGKGSTASFIASILIELGFKVGLYTSPHFVRFNERIRINGKEIDDEYIARLVTNLDSYIDEHKPTFFELTTALAFKYFAEQKVDYAVIETGLGGRLDSTNVINPLASVITSISLEHTNILGDSIEKIAYEKAGIIKRNIPVLIGNLPAEAKNVIKERAGKLNSKLLCLQDYTEIRGDHLSVRTRLGDVNLYLTPLPGFHQLQNAALAIKAITEILEVKDQLKLFRGIQNVVGNTGIQGRYEIVSSNPRMIMDSAHNPEGIESFVREFKKEYSQYSNRCLIFGALKDKDYSSMLGLLEPYFGKIVITQIGYERAASVDDMMKAASAAGFTELNIDEPLNIITRHLGKDNTDCLVILGSMYLLGEIKSKILEKGLDIKRGTD